MTKEQTFVKDCRESIPEGIVLLESDGALPLVGGENVALFGRGQFEYVKSGTGSGGRVNCPYVTNIGDELDKRVNLDKEVLDFFRSYVKENPFDVGDGWCVPASQKQPFLDEEFVKEAAKRNEKAVFVLCRVCGESYDCKLERGNWYLSEAEEQNIALLCKHFKKVVVLINSGNLIDMSWVKTYNVGTVAYVWQGGQEGGAGTVAALMGDIPPSGRLTDTIACSHEKYPSTDCFGAVEKNIHKEDIFVGYRYFETFDKDSVLYPFGYGLNYTRFSTALEKAEKTGDEIRLSVRVKNVGNYRGKEVVQVYYAAPSGALGYPARQLVAFQKTDMLAAGEEQALELCVNVRDLAAYDDGGKSGFAYAWVLEAGEHTLFVGENVRAAKKAYSFTQETTRVVRQCTQALAPRERFERMIEKDGKAAWESAPTAQYDLSERIRENLPQALEITGDKGMTLRDVKVGKATLDEFVAQFDERALMQLVRGEGMSSPKAPMPGTASCFAGVSEVWNDKGVPVVTTCDGPSGVRMESSASATCIPSGTLVASAWSPEAFERVFDGFAEEMIRYDVDVILAPGMNIHRNPLGGRNFEYFSEDPYLTGRYAAKLAEYFTRRGVYCTLKHFAVNSQERNRGAENEVLSERAAREIYLKPFEIAVKGGYVRSIMTSYNRINGVSAAGNYDLTTTILRGEWGYTGFVMTDWWTRIDDPVSNTHAYSNLAAMVKAQNDVYMVTPDATTYADDQKAAYESGYLTLGELQRCVKNLVAFSMQTLAFKKGTKRGFVDLSKATELICKQSLSEVPLTTCTPEECYPFGGQLVHKASVETGEEGFYCAELTYRLDGDALVQYSLKFSLDGREPIVVVCNGTNGELGKTRIKVYLKERSHLLFPEGQVVEFALYKL